ncbi:hypothetical protein ACU4HD_22210 [Cupriavidus basilensis]
MTINELAHSAQHHLLASTGTQVKRTHIYELLAATFGFSLLCRIQCGGCFTECHLFTRTARIDGTGIRHRCAQLGYDHGDLQRCWTWIYLAALFGTDLTEDDYYAIDEHGSPYDDDVGGPAYVGGQDGVKLDPIGLEQDAAARLAAERLFREIEPTSGK